VPARKEKGMNEPSCVIGVDPGPESSAYVIWDGERIIGKDNRENKELLSYFAKWDEQTSSGHYTRGAVLAIEQIRGFGVMASDGLFDTCWWTGRFFQAFGEHRTYMVPRKKAAAHICGVGGISKDQFVREALIARFGGKDVAVGKKSAPGPLYGISGHLWPALAVALTYWDLKDIDKSVQYGTGVPA